MEGETNGQRDPNSHLEHDICIHIFTVSSAMVGVCLTVIGLIRVVITLGRADTLADDLLAGDALLFGISMMHSTLPNTTDRYRLSIDTRYQLAAEPVDERFIGANGSWQGNYSYQNPAPRKPMKELRAGWGV